MIGLLLARYRYNRVTFRGIIRGGTEPFCTKVYATGIPKPAYTDALALRVAWA